MNAMDEWAPDGGSGENDKHEEEEYDTYLQEACKDIVYVRKGGGKGCDGKGGSGKSWGEGAGKSSAGW